MGPLFGTRDSSVAPDLSLPKSTLAAKWLTSPEASASAWARSRHQVASRATPAAPSTIVFAPPGDEILGSGSPKRKARLKSAPREGAPPPGRVAEAGPAWGAA